jgi:hypothetical protein
MECSNPMQTHSIKFPRSNGSLLPPPLLQLLLLLL